MDSESNRSPEEDRLHAAAPGARSPASATSDQRRLSQAPGETAVLTCFAPAAWWPITLAASLIVLGALAAYYNSFAGPFVYDDVLSIVENQTIRQLWPIGRVLSPPPSGMTVSGRPLLNFSLAINYAFGGLNVWGYHAVNLAIHIAAALLLFGILRRTFLLPALRERFGSAALPLALACVLVWVVHPLQTESVTYIVQRAESLAGFFYLLTLYCVIRGAGAGTVPFFAAQNPTLPNAVVGEKGDCPPSLPPSLPGRYAWLWYAGAVLACLLGMATKEVMVTAPLVVLLYDRTFLAGSFADALRQRWKLYAGLAATWGLLALLVLSTGLIFRQSELLAPDAMSYARSQPGVILHYLRLSVWPSPLCCEYPWSLANTLGEILPGVIVVGLLLAATLWGLTRRQAWGFLGAWFLLILTPTSSILPLTAPGHEHRMYLSLAAVTVLAVAGGYALWDRLLSRLPVSKWTCVSSGKPTACATACKDSENSSKPSEALLAGNRLQLDSLQAVLPANPLQPFSPAGHHAPRGRGTPRFSSQNRATFFGHGAPVVRWAAPVVVLVAVLTALGYATVARNRDYRTAIALYQDTIDKCPHNPGAQAMVSNVLGITLAADGRTEEAIEQYRQALRLKPDYAEPLSNLGFTLAELGRTDEAIEQCKQTLRLKPDFAEVHNILAVFLAGSGKTAEATAHYQEALRLKPDFPAAHNNLGLILAGSGRTAEATAHYREALRLRPDFADAHSNLGLALAAVGRWTEAIEHYHRALDLKPDYVEARNNLGIALASLGKFPEAIEHYRQVLRLKPDFATAHYNLASILDRTERTREAAEHYDHFLRLRPNSVEALHRLAWLLATHDPADGGDPGRAVQLAEWACALTRQQTPQCLDTLAAAYAAAGRFPEAVITAEKAVQLAESAGQAPLAKLLRSRLESYRAGRPYREAPRSAGRTP